MIKIFYTNGKMPSSIKDYKSTHSLIYETGNNGDYSLTSLKITSEINKYGTLELSGTNKSRLYYLIDRSGINSLENFFVYQDDELIWKGFPLDIEYDFYGNINVVAVDIFYIILNGVTQIYDIIETMKLEQYKNGIPLGLFMETLFKEFADFQSLDYGSASIGDFILEINGSIYNELINPVFSNKSIYQYLGDIFQENILDILGGYFLISFKDTKNYITYVDGDHLEKNESQKIDNSNIIELTKKIKQSGLYSGVLGIQNDSYFKKKYEYERDFNSFRNVTPIYEIVSFDIPKEGSLYDQAMTLKDLTKDYYDKNIKNRHPVVEIEVKAFDLSLINSTNIKPFKIGELIKIVSENHGINDYFICQKIVKDFLNPENSEYYFGGSGDGISKIKNDYSKKFDYSLTYSRNGIINLNERVNKLEGG